MLQISNSGMQSQPSLYGKIMSESETIFVVRFGPDGNSNKGNMWWWQWNSTSVTCLECQAVQPLKDGPEADWCLNPGRRGDPPGDHLSLHQDDTGTWSGMSSHFTLILDPVLTFRFVGERWHLQGWMQVEVWLNVKPSVVMVHSITPL